MNDTDQAAEAFQIDLIRRADSIKRFHAVRSLSETVMRFSQDAIKRASPQLSDEEVGLKFVEYHYGEDLAKRLKSFLDLRSS